MDTAIENNNNYNKKNPSQIVEFSVTQKKNS